MSNYERTEIEDGDWQTRHVAAYFNIHSRTVARWLADSTLGFPKPIMIRHRRFWNAAEVKHWRQSLKRPLAP